MTVERISSEDDIGLVVLQKEDQQYLVKYLSLILSYLYDTVHSRSSSEVLVAGHKVCNI